VPHHGGLRPHRRLLGRSAWLLDDERFGVVYQDARPGPRSGYSRIGWHSDHQSGPHLEMWPSVAFTINLDATSPQNGFLRVVPGSHRGGTDGMPPGFERVAGERAVYCERGDVLFHHYDLWHAAARATEDGRGAIRRHVRGGWYAGSRLEPGHTLDDFVKNAAR
jgi:ectoine hydroxylase-related dioxygenase (phytanoyl-CoA dioxygenase family)